MLCVLDVNETLLDVAALDDFFADLAGDVAARREWFELLVHHAMALTAAGRYRPFGEIAAACLVPVVAARGGTGAPGHQRGLGERLRRPAAPPGGGGGGGPAARGRG